MELLDDSTSDGVRTLRMRITPPSQATLLAVTADAEERVADAAVDGARVPNGTSGSAGSPAWTLNYWSPPPEGVELTLEVEGTGPLTLTATAATPGLPTIPGESYRDRPPDMMTHRYEDRTLVSKSFTFAARSSTDRGSGGTITYAKTFPALATVHAATAATARWTPCRAACRAHAQRQPPIVSRHVLQIKSHWLRRPSCCGARGLLFLTR